MAEVSLWCPACKDRLNLDNDFLKCQNCLNIYPIKNGIPYFLKNVKSDKASIIKFNILAQVYELFEYSWYFKFFSGVECPTRTELREMIGGLFKIKGAILDVSSGPGTLTRHLANKDSKVFAVDYSMEMIGKGLGYIKRDGIENYKFLCSIVESLPFANQSFDGAVMGFALYLYKDPVLVLKEIKRVLKPGSKLVVVTFFNGNGGILKYDFGRFFASLKGMRIYKIEEIKEIFKKAGFSEFNPKTYGSLMVFSTVSKQLE